MNRPENNIPTRYKLLPPLHSDIEYAATFPEIIPEQIGPVIGEGTFHLVYEYGPENVIKIPRLAYRVFPIITLERVRREQKTVKKYFSEYVRENTTLESLSLPGYVIVQRRVRAENITPRNVGEVMEELTRLVSANHRLIENEGVSFDFLGFQGVLDSSKALVDPSYIPSITNILLEKEINHPPRITMVDLGLLTVDNRRSDTTGVDGLQVIFFNINRALIKYHFGLDIKE